MFDISFYSANGEPSDSVRITANTYEWLAKSDFSKIGGASIDTEIHLDEENVILPGDSPVVQENFQRSNHQ
jgi:hypothetical protein